MRPLTNVQTGTLGGTLCSLFASITLDDIVKTIVLAAIGAMVSFTVSRLIHRATKARAEKGPKNEN